MGPIAPHPQPHSHPFQFGRSGGCVVVYCVIVVLTRTPLITGALEELCMYHRAIWISSFVKCVIFFCLTSEMPNVLSFVTI